MEYVGGGDLFEHILKKQRLTEHEAVVLFRQMVSAVEYMHANLIIHRGTKATWLVSGLTCSA